MQRLSIGEMARLNNISVQALRLYGKMGLVEPNITNPETGYRYYDVRQSAVLDMIQYMKSLGLSLNEIKAQLDEQQIDVILAALDERLDEVEKQIDQLRVSKRGIQNLIHRLNVYQSIKEIGTIVEEQIPERLIHSYVAGRDFHAEGPESFETLLRQMKKHVQESRLPLSYFCQVGSIIAADSIRRREFLTSRIFIAADKYSARFMETETIPAGRYLCVYFENFRNEAACASRLLDEIEQRGLSVCGDYICETIAEFPIFRKAERNTFIKIQIPVH